GKPHALAGIATAPEPLSPEAAAVAVALCDHDTPVWLDAPLAVEPQVAAWLKFHAGTPMVDDPGRAAFAFLADPASAPSFDRFSQGTPEYPDRSTTLILQIDRFDGGQALILEGAGIATTQALRAAPLPADIIARLADNRARFPCGIDL